jgi:hypothetical protein
MSKLIKVQHGNKEYIIPNLDEAIKLGAIYETYPDDCFRPGSVFHKVDEKGLEVYRKFCIVQAADVGPRMYAMVCVEQSFQMMRTFHAFNLFTMDEIKEYVCMKKIQHKGFIKNVVVE